MKRGLASGKISEVLGTIVATLQSRGLILDVFGDPAADPGYLERELAATPQPTDERRAVLLFELARWSLARNQDKIAEQTLRQAVDIYPAFVPPARLLRCMAEERDDAEQAAQWLLVEADHCADPIVRAQLLREYALLVWARLHRLPSARSAAEEAAKIDPGDLGGHFLLEHIFLASDQRAQRCTMLRRALDTTADQGLQAALHVDLALEQDQNAQRLADVRRARDLAPDSELVLLALELQLLRAGDTHAYGRVLIRRAELSNQSKRRRARLLADAARVMLSAGESDQSAACFRDSLEIWPERFAAREYVELLLQREEYEKVVDATLRLLELESCSRRGAALCCQAGDILQWELGQPSASIDWYRRGLRLDPTHEAALQALDELLADREHVDELVQLHRSALHSVPEVSQTRAERLFRIAALLERQERLEEAIATHREILAEFPAYWPASAALEQLYVRLGRWSDQLSLLDERLAQLSDVHEVQETLHSAVHTAHGHLHDPVRAAGYQRRLVDMNSDDLPAVRRLARLCAEAGQYREVADLCEHETRLVATATQQAQLLHRSGEIYEASLDDVGAAIERYRSALSVDPAFVPALRALGRLLRRQERWPDLVEMHRAELERTEDERAALALLYAIADILEEQIRDPAQVIAVYREILDRFPGETAARRTLLARLEKAGRWQELSVLLDQPSSADESRQDKALRLWRLGRVYEDKLGDDDRAIVAYQRAVNADRRLVVAEASLVRILDKCQEFQRLALTLRRRLQSDDAEPRLIERIQYADVLGLLGDDPPLRSVAAYESVVDEDSPTWLKLQLADLYRQLGRPRRELQIRQQVADQAEDRRLLTSLHLRMAQLRQTLETESPAADYQKILSQHPTLTYAQRALERCAREEGAEDRLIESLVARIDQADDPLTLCCNWTELAEAFVADGDAPQAERAFSEALRHIEGHLPALWGLSGLMNHQGRWRECAEVLQTLATTSECRKTRVSAFLQAAGLLQDKLDDLHAAEAIYKRILKEAPDHRIAYERLREIHTTQSQWSALAALLRSRLSGGSDPGKAPDLFLELGRLYLEKLNQRHRGLACLKRVVDLLPDTPDPRLIYALKLLADQAFSAGLWAEAVDLYERLQRLCEATEDLSLIGRRLGHAFLALEQPESAVDAFSRALAAGKGGDLELLQTLAKAAELAGDTATMCEALDGVATEAPHASDRISAYRSLARLHEESGRIEEASKALKKALKADPVHLDCIQQLAGLHAKAGNREHADRHLAAAVDAHREAIDADPFAVPMYRQLGRIYRWQRQLDPLYCCCSVLEHLNAADQVERQFLRDHKRRRREEVRPLEASALDQLVLGGDSPSPLLQVTELVGPLLQPSSRAIAARYRLKRQSRLSSQHALARYCQMLGDTLFGELNLEIWVTTTTPDLVRATKMTRPAIILGSEVAAAPSHADRFRIGRAMFQLAKGSYIVQDADEDEVRSLIAELRQIGPGDADKTKPLTRGLSRRHRRDLARQLPALLAQLEPDALLFDLKRVHCAEVRAALLAMGDPRIALGAIARLSNPLPSVERGDLLRFIVSTDYLAYRDNNRKQTRSSRNRGSQAL